MLALAVTLRPTPVVAHPLGNFTINRYNKLVFAENRVTVTYILDFAEIPTYQEMQELDADDDGQVSQAEGDVYLDAMAPRLVKGLRLVVGDDVVSLTVLDRGALLAPGQAGLQTLRIVVHLSGALPDGWQADGLGGYTDRNYNDRLGWREIVIQGGPGVAIENSSAPAVDQSDELRSYPEGGLSNPLNTAEATFTLVPGNEGAVTADNDTAGKASEEVKTGSGKSAVTDRVTSLITAKEMSPTVVLVAILAAAFWGAVHALTPGHGKTVVAAYLVGARGTTRHAAFLGLTVTLTHTIGVFALGGVTLYLSRYILPETLYPWLSLISGALVVAIGGTLMYRRLRYGFGHSHRHDHDQLHDDQHTHDHDHDHAHHHEHEHGHSHVHGEHTHTHDGSTHSHAVPGMDGSRVTWRSLLALGISGGLIPCPSALVLLLASISLDRLELGIVLVFAFSFGLAAVLTAIGLLLVYARGIFQRMKLEPRVPRLLPVASALVISVAGLAIMLDALGKTGVV
jgi:ABC-type nickel/cobalt efflux system permease component RcnA